MTPASFTTQVRLLVIRGLRGMVRNPATMLPNGVLSAFFLIVYNSLHGSSDSIQLLVGGSFVNFVLPVAVMAASLAGANAGLALVQDVETGCFHRQLTHADLTVRDRDRPDDRGRRPGRGPGIVVAVLGVLLGADPATGAPGLVAMVAFGVLWGVGFGGCAAAVALRTGNAEATSATSLLLFPMIYLSPAFLPENQLQGWIRIASDLNPGVIHLQAMRAPIVDGWDATALCHGALAAVAFALVTLSMASTVARVAIFKALRTPATRRANGTGGHALPRVAPTRRAGPHLARRRSELRRAP